MKQQHDHEMFSQKLKTLLAFETILTEHLSHLLERANNLGLRKALAFHLAETRQQRVTIEAICKQLDIELQPGGYGSDIKEILNKGDKRIEDHHETASVDETIIASAIEVEEYEITMYGQAAMMASDLGYRWISNCLYLIREEEKQARNKLRFLKAQLVEQTAEIGYH